MKNVLKHSKYCRLHGSQGRRSADWADIRLWRNAERVTSAERHKGRIIENRFFVSVLSGCTVALHFNDALLVSKGLESIDASEGSKGL